MTVSPAMWAIFQKLVQIKPRNPFPGKVCAIWAKVLPELETMVKKEKLQPLTILTEKQMNAGPAAAAAGELFWWRPDGGWPLPHLHVGDRIYPVTDIQWRAFSAQVLTKVGASLQNARVQAKVGFEPLMEITESTAKF